MAQISLGDLAGTGTEDRSGLTFQPVLGAPAVNVRLLGAATQGAPGEVWGYGQLSEPQAATSGGLEWGAIRYTRDSGVWQPVPFADAQGGPLNVEPAWPYSVVTPSGGFAVLARADGVTTDDFGRLATRDPNGGFVIAPAPPSATPPADARDVSPSEPPVTDPTPSEPTVSGTDPRAAHDASGDGEAATGAVMTNEATSPDMSQAPATPTTTPRDPEATTTPQDPAATTTANDDPAAPADPVLEAGERLYAGEQDPSLLLRPTIAAIDEAGRTGALVLPARDGDARAAPGVLHYDGSSWTREAICIALVTDRCTPPTDPLLTPTLVASGPDDAWLLARTGNRATLFQRMPSTGDTRVWLQRRPQSPLLGAGAEPLATTPRKLTVTAQGAWVDLDLDAAHGSGTLLVPAAAPDGPPIGTWCYPRAACADATGALAAPLPSDAYGSVAFPGTGADPGTRIVTGLPRGVQLRLQGNGTFDYVVGAGTGGATAAFSAPDDGWTGALAGTTLLRVAATAVPSPLTSWPVPFRYPLLALASQPGRAAGDADAQMLAVGDRGQAARFAPGRGWQPEFMYGASGARATPRLRGVAWPESGRAYAVGDEGEMWLWRSDTGLWEPDPGKPLNFHGNLNAVAFSPSDPNVGYAVGKQGVLLAYGRMWTQEALPEGIQQQHLTDVAFAGTQALATYSTVATFGTPVASSRSGLLVRDGAGWRIDDTVTQLLRGRALTRVAGLRDGGAVAAGPGVVIERDGPSAPWREGPPLSGQQAPRISALAALRDGASVRALVSVDTDGTALADLDINDQPSPPPGQPPLFIDPDPLPVTGYLLRENAGGWQDVQHGAYVESGIDAPAWPDPVLALAVDPAGTTGWAVGGNTGGRQYSGGVQGGVQTASAQRYGAGPAPPAAATVPVGAPPGMATFALAGGAQCAQLCADSANLGVGPDVWLRAAVNRAAQIPDLRAFLYAGSRLSPTQRTTDADAFGRELMRYSQILRGSGATLPTYAAASAGEAAVDGSIAPFVAALGPSAPAGSVPPGTPQPPAGIAAYAFDSEGATGPVRVIVLDTSRRAVAPGRTSGACSATAIQDQLDWLCAQLDAANAAQVPALVVANADLLDASAPNHAADSDLVVDALVNHGASAYLFQSVEKNVQQTLGVAPRTVPAFGTGTLGYVTRPTVKLDEFLGDSGFLLVSVDVARRNPVTNVAPVSALTIPNAGQLALDATDGLLLRRSSVALFTGLARRPLGGNSVAGTAANRIENPDPYVAIPSSCIGASCGQQVPLAYRFTSSNPDIGDFVARDPNSTNPRAVLQGVDGKPLLDPASGLFCAFNAGNTTVTVESGGLSYSQDVTILRGSVQQPCGTVPLRNPPPARQIVAQTEIEPPDFTAPPDEEPARRTPTEIDIAPPLPPSPSAQPQPTPAQRSPAPKAPVRAPPPPLSLAIPVAAALIPIPVRAAVPPPPPSPARPTPPSGTSQVQGQSPVSQTASAPERQREQEVATELMHHMAAYEPDRTSRAPSWPLSVALLVIAAGAGATLRLDRRRRTSNDPGRLAYATARDRRLRRG
ncbi:hypothetical protein [Conexibacter sp. CPCC 206217]|uniref:hypothetical protein n=1 Tax=Conexibacter sp. CPCC 206217 TaxID=3064574 RepID=UPI002722BF74|nr:hypothetical protein [Conexibacter sp. CPCC 206217]MDO8209330.1 hypothetical protein [Conexibacter sp. CPCC 206217]